MAQTVFDPRLGYRDHDGSLTMPELTVSGAPYNAANTPAQHGLSHGYFVVLDADGAPDADVIEKLKAKIAPAPETLSEKRGNAATSPKDKP